MAEFIEVMTFLNRHEAELARGLLDEKDIVAMISSDDCGGFRPNLSFGMGNVKLLVSSEQIEQAKEILKVLEEE